MFTSKTYSPDFLIGFSSCVILMLLD